MSKVILDSDDESLEAVSPVLQKHERLEDAKGTGSTTRLMRDMQAAANGLIGTGTDGTDELHYNESQHLSALLKSSKRQETINIRNGSEGFFSNGCSSPASSIKRRKTVKTYGSSNERVRTARQDEEDRFESLRNDRMQTEVHLAPTWDLPATLRMEFAQNEPTPMFSEPSSTIPVNTASQQRIIQECLAVEGLDVSPPKSNPTQQSESSIPWSAYLASQAKSTNPPKAPDESALTGFANPPSSTLTRRSKTLSARSQSPQPLRRFSPVQDGFKESSPLQSKTSKSLRRSKTANAKPSSSKVLKQSTQKISEIEVATNEEIMQIQELSEMSFVAEKSNSSNTKVETSSPKGLPKLASDDWIGLPKEEYKPRPSRSRSTQVSEASKAEAARLYQPKPRVKRRKTSHETSILEAESLVTIIDMGFTPKRAKMALQDADGIVERAVGILAASPSRGKGSTVESSFKSRENAEIGDVQMAKQAERAIPIEKASSTPKSTLVSVEIYPGLPSKTDRQRTTADANHSELRMKILDKGPQPMAKLPAATRKGRAQRRHTTAAIPARSHRERIVDSDEESDAANSPYAAKLGEIDELAFDPEESLRSVAHQPEAAQEKKGGRGRPRKITAQVVATTMPKVSARATTKTDDDEATNDADEGDTAKLQDETNSEDQQGDQSTEQPMKKSTTMPASTSIGKVTPKTSVSTDCTVKESVVTKSRELPSTPEEQRTTSRSATPQNLAMEKSPFKHSPIGKSKVPLRVGLSKRTRIAPLLKIMRR